MPDIIQLLPDSVANQIAAGEVVQRPASVVKELLENAIDAGATSIKLICRDAGKTLVQVIDNGLGMSESDARMSFERHATSKIKTTEDIFHISTKGFRGEALASIAAVAQVELKTRRKEDELGVWVEMEASAIKRHELTQCPQGSSFIVKNLFFNVPARRYFLKSDPIELKHIVDEFHRVVLTHPDMHFSLNHNGTEVFNLPVTTLRQRIVHVFGSRYNEKLVPLDESTDIVSVQGFVGKPDAARKARGEQFFFVNRRFIRNNYLHHAVMSAFDNLLSPGTYPFYMIYLEVDPAQIDINIHPTKTEIKFQDERSIYAILHASVRRALGKFNVAPTIDFDQETSIRVAPLSKNAEIRPPSIAVNPLFNPFHNENKSNVGSGGFGNWKENPASQGDWRELMQIAEEVGNRKSTADNVGNNPPAELAIEVDDKLNVFQFNRRYLVTSSRNGIIVIDQQRAHQKVLFDAFLSQMERGTANSQQVMFPESIELGPTRMALFNLWKIEFEKLGFTFEIVSDTSVNLTGLPSDAGNVNPTSLLGELLDGFSNETDSSAQNIGAEMAWTLAKASSISYGQMLSKPEMEALVQQLLASDNPQYTPKGVRVMTIFTNEQFDQIFR